MANDVKWIKITTDIFSDEKILLIEQMPEADTMLVIWFKLLCMAGKENNYGVFLLRNRMPYTEEMLATIFRRPLNTVRLALSTFEAFGMIEIEDDIICIPNWEKHQNVDGLEKIREQTRNRVARYRERQKLIACNGKSNVTVTECNETEEEIDKDIEIDKEKDKKKSKKESTRTLFTRLLPDYNISENLKAKVFEWITYKTERKESYQEQGMKTLLRRLENNALTYGDEAVMCLIDDSMSNGWKGIIFDRLKQQKPTRKEPTPKWMSKNQNQYDFDDLESKLLANGTRTAANDPDIKARADALKQQFRS